MDYTNRNLRIYIYNIQGVNMTDGMELIQMMVGLAFGFGLCLGILFMILMIAVDLEAKKKKERKRKMLIKHRIKDDEINQILE